MNTTSQDVKKAAQGLDDLIEKALKKIGGNKENDLCRYLPVNGGYMHHFTLRKMKNESPEELTKMINEFVISPGKPKTVPPRPRAARGSRKRGDRVVLNDDDVKRLLNIARLANDQEMIRKLTPKKSLAAIKRELIASIRQGKVLPDLWTAYAESIQSQSAELRQEEATESPASWKNLPGMK